MNNTNIQILSTLTCLLLLVAGCQKAEPIQATADVAHDPATQTIDAGSVAQTIDARSNSSDELESNNQQELPTLDESLENPIDVESDVAAEPQDEIPEVQTIEIPATWKRLSPKHEIWVDYEAKQVIAAGNICMSEGPLEMFACPRGTKEHESIVSLNALGSQIHPVLIVLGAEPGHPVKWQDEYEAATGPIIHIDVIWSENGQQQKIKAQDMVMNVKTQELSLIHI